MSIVKKLRRVTLFVKSRVPLALPVCSDLDSSLPMRRRGPTGSENTECSLSRKAPSATAHGVCLLLFLSTVLSCGVCTAHPISLTEARVLIQREKVSVKLNVFVEDLFLFHGLEPNKENFLSPESIAEAREKHREFLLERFLIRDVAGELLPGKVLEVETFEMPKEGIGMGDLMNFVYTYNIEYPLDVAPDYLTFSQRMVDETAGLPAETRMELLQAGSDTPFFVTLYPEAPETLRFDWTRPPLSPEASEGEWDQWYETRRRQELGITDYSSVYSFLYVEDHEVRHEILIPLLTLESSVLIARRDEAFLELDEQSDAKKQVGQFFASGNAIEIDGIVVQPKVDRVDFYGVDFKDFAKQAPERRVAMANARAGVILSYSCKDTPASVKLNWDQFNDDIWRVNGIVYAFDDVERHVFSRGQAENVFQWKNPGRAALPPIENVSAMLPNRQDVGVHWFSIAAVALTVLMTLVLRMFEVKKKTRVAAFVVGVLICVGSFRGPQIRFEDPFAAPPRIVEEDARRIVQVLQQNVYRAFDYRDEEQVYDALEKSVHGRLLEEVYLTVQDGLKMEEQGGAKSKVQRVELIGGKIEDPFDWESGFRFRCTWNVEGTVEHWGHIHSRTNQYQAILRVRPEKNAWRIVDLDVLDEERLVFETKVRGL
jgi:hypothetical protein